MKAAVILALGFGVLAITAPAQGKLVVGPSLPVVAISVDDTAIATGPAGALLESNYFNAPSPTPNFGRGNSCRAPVSLFEKTRLAQACK